MSSPFLKPNVYSPSSPVDKYIKSLLTEVLVKQYPIVDALFSIMSSTIDKKVETLIAERIDALSKEIAKTPNAATVETTIANSASDIASRLEFRVPQETKSKAEKGISSLRMRRENLDRGAKRVDEEVQLRITKLMDQLSSPNESLRENAVARLSMLGDMMKKRQVTRLHEMLRDTNMRWSKPVSHEGHCTWYEFKNAAYYAGRSLENLRSEHVTNTMVRDAKKAVEAGQGRRRITEPGWI
jgi:hypothetical protein